MMKTAILLSGTAYNFRFSLPSMLENLVIPNDADVFMVTSRSNMRRKAPHTAEDIQAEDAERWHAKAMSMIRDISRDFTPEDLEFVKDVLGDRLKGFQFIEDIPGYEPHLADQRRRMQFTVNEYRKESLRQGIPAPYKGFITDPNDYHIRCVVDQYHHVRQCYRLMGAGELVHGFQYDVVMRARADFYCPQVFQAASRPTIMEPLLHVCGSVRRDPFEWSDEFCWFSNRDIARRLFPSLDAMGFITDRKYNTIYPPQDNDFRFAPETQFSLLMYELGIEPLVVKIYRSCRFTDGGDGFDYMNYKFSRESE